MKTDPWRVQLFHNLNQFFGSFIFMVFQSQADAALFQLRDDLVKCHGGFIKYNWIEVTAYLCLVVFPFSAGSA